MGENVHDILGVRVDDLSRTELESKLHSFLITEGAKIVVTPNPEFVLAAQVDPDFKAILKEADLALPDGVGLKFAVAALHDNERLRNRHTGGDVLTVLAQISATEKKKLLILGGSGKDPEIVGQMLRALHPDLDVVACDPGIIDDELPRLSEAVTARLIAIDPAVVAVALGQGRGRSQGKQEKVMAYLKKQLPNVRVLVGVGGVIRVMANPHLTAPAFMRRFGFEWLWRLIHQPWRAERIFKAVVLFPLEIIWATLRYHRFFRALRNVFRELRAHFSSR